MPVERKALHLGKTFRNHFRHIRRRKPYFETDGYLSEKIDCDSHGEKHRIGDPVRVIVARERIDQGTGCDGHHDVENGRNCRKSNQCTEKPGPAAPLLEQEFDHLPVGQDACAGIGRVIGHWRIGRIVARLMNALKSNNLCGVIAGGRLEQLRANGEGPVSR